MVLGAAAHAAEAPVSKAIRKVFGGEHSLPVTSTKGVTGHLIGGMSSVTSGRRLFVQWRGIESFDVATLAPGPVIEAPAIYRLHPSPDGRWLAYQSDETGKYEIYVRAADGTGGKWQISAGGGMGARWVSGGKGIVYANARRLMLANVAAGGANVVVDSLSTLFAFDERGIAGTNFMDITGDGERILAAARDSRGVIAPITLEIDWDHDLRKP